jgi:hypothetical protein
MNTDYLIQKLKIFYYSDILMLVVELIALTIAIRHSKKNKFYLLFVFYIGFDLLFLLANFYLLSSTKIRPTFKYEFRVTTNSLIGFVELWVYYYFFRSVLNNKIISRVLKIVQVFYLCLVLLFLFTRLRFISDDYGYVSDLIEVLDFIFLIPPCIVFYFELLNNKSKLQLFERPSFWIVTGIFFYALVSIPFYLLQKSLNVSHNLQRLLVVAFYYLPFILNILFLTKAFLCKADLRK